MFPVVYISHKAFFARQLIVFRFLTLIIVWNASASLENKRKGEKSRATVCKDAASAKRPRSVGVSSYMLYFLLKFNLPTNFYFFATDIATIERDLKIVFGFVHSTEVHKSHICVKWNMRKMQMLYSNSFEI